MGFVPLMESIMRVAVGCFLGLLPIVGQEEVVPIEAIYLAVYAVRIDVEVLGIAGRTQHQEIYHLPEESTQLLGLELLTFFSFAFDKLGQSEFPDALGIIEHG